MIIAISGKQRSGKDTATEVFLHNLPELNLKIANFASSLKQEVAEHFNLTLEELDLLKNSDPDYREILVAWSKIRKKHDLYYFVDQVLNCPENKGRNLIISDVSYQYELAALRNSGEEVFAVRVDSNKVYRSQRGVLSCEDDESETSLDKYKDWDYKLTNNATMDSFISDCNDCVLEIMTAYTYPLKGAIK